MKAFVLDSRPDGYGVRDYPDPTPKPGEAVMRVRASSINRVDLYMRNSGAGITHKLPLVLGVDGAGEIVEAPPESGLKPGQRVTYHGPYCGRCRYCREGETPLCLRPSIAGEHRDGAYAEYMSLPAHVFTPLPDEVSFADAGALGAAYVTAWRMMFGKRALRPSESVLIVGVGGGVAVACLQLASMIGARAIVTSSSDAKLARAKTLGADAGINYRTAPNVAEQVLELTKGEGVDMVIDSVGEASWGQSLRSLRRGGRIVTCGATTGSNPPVEIQRMFIRQLEVYGSTGGNQEEAREMMALCASGKIKPIIDQTYSLLDIGQAYDRLEKGEQFGKLSIRVD
ncbi:MAG: zinc-binding dehydrogenase [Hyphomonadaceae bacterium]